MEKFDIVNDLATVTTIPEHSLHKLFEKETWCICNAVVENSIQGSMLTECDIGIGTLLVEVVENQIQYKFIPTQKFERGLVESIVNKKNPLVVKLEESFANRIVKTYKDML